jgi:hypothetical protein
MIRVYVEESEVAVMLQSLSALLVSEDASSH